MSPRRGRRGSSFQEEPLLEQPERLRLLFLGVLVLILVMILGVRLAVMQIHGAEESNTRISNQSLRRIRIPARRGKIYTQDMQLLAGSSPNSNLVFYPQEMQIRGSRTKTVQYMFDAAQAISRAIGRSTPLTPEDISRHLNMQPGLPLTLFQALNSEELARALEAGREFNGVDIEPDESRTYPAGTLAAHLIGYTRLDDPRKAEDRKEFSYYIPDRIGVEGIERAFDTLPGTPELTEEDYEPGSPDRPLGLRGLPGYSLVQVDHLGIIRKKVINRIEPRNGNNVVLTIDSRAQRIAAETIAGKCAALVLLDAENGDILASASSPGYDLSYFAPYIRSDYFQSLRTDPEVPLYNRAFQGRYAPGSILKPLIALAYLNAGVNPEEETVCDGKSVVLGVTINCNSRYGHGPVNLRRALARSCNDYMIDHSQTVKLPPIAETLRQAGIGSRTGIELADNAGTFPSSENKMRLQRLRWNSYDTALLSIGQGTIALSPLQAALYTAAIANGGKLWKPHLVSKVVDGSGNPLFERKPELRSTLEAVPGALELIRQGMFDVVNTSTGSGRRAEVPGLALYGKTGTAEVSSGGERFKIVWFISFVTYEGRTYSCCVMVERGDSGSQTAAPLAAEFFRRFLLEKS